MVFIKKQRKQLRLRKWDYSSTGYYFVTICTFQKIDYFGKIINGKMIFNQFCGIVNNYWEQIPNHNKNIELDEYITMPNHIHGIIIIRNKICKNNDINVGNADLRSLRIQNDRSKM
jgi:putative transposase